MVVLKSQGTVIEKSNVVRRLVGTTSPRTGVQATTILGCIHGTVKQRIELSDAFGIANDLSSAGVENRFPLSNHFHRISIHPDSDLIEGCLPVTLSRQSTLYTHLEIWQTLTDRGTQVKSSSL